MNILVTICGRGGSKGVKNKNIRKFLGYPLILYTISAAEMLKNNLKNYNVDIVINSDSWDINELAKKTKVCETIVRPKELAQDGTPKVNVIRHSVNFMEEKNNKKYNYVIDLDITSPLRSVNDIQNCLEKLMRSDQYDVIFSVAPSRRNPYFNMIEVNDGFAHKIKTSNYVARQQTPQVYDMNASIYVYKRDSIINKLKSAVFDGNCGIYTMKDTYVLDIDSEDDFEIMELLAKEYYFKQSSYNLIRQNITQMNSNN